MNKTNIKYFDSNTNITLTDIESTIAKTLDISNNIVDDLNIKESIEIKQNNINTLNSMVNNNNRLTEFSKTIKNEKLKQKINDLKNRFAKLQLKSMIKDETPDTQNIIGEILTSVNNKLETMNNIYETKLEPKPQYEYKYLKYKIKYYSKLVV